MLPTDTAFDRMVDLAKLRWRIERDYQELKQELGLTKNTKPLIIPTTFEAAELCGDCMGSQ
jgi:hypothetical protein